jgi:hypothetical protein
VLATGLVFLEVGLSEDRERARHARQTPTSPSPEHPAKPRLARMRGRHRRLQ